MKYTIKKISISESESWKLINGLVKKTREAREDDLDKRGVEIVFEGKTIDVVMKIKFNSEYIYEDFGRRCVGRGVSVEIKMIEHETGGEVEYDSPVAMEEEIGSVFWV